MLASLEPFPPGQDPRKTPEENAADLQLYGTFTGGYGPSPVIGEANFSSKVPLLLLAALGVLLVTSR